jgi:hypothetical protein
MANPTGELIAELNTLLRLTQTETTIAQTRRAQATSDRIERELRQNAEKCEERSRLLTDTIRDLGGVPDVVGGAFGVVAANAKAFGEQGQTPAEALLGDLTLEHQLFDRARYVKMLAKAANKTRVVRAMERLENAHGKTIEWIETRLGEVAVGGPVALQPSPTQLAVGYAQRLAFFPTRQYVDFVNRTVASVRAVRNEATDAVGSGGERARQIFEAAARVWTSGRDAALERTEDEARRAGAGRAAKAVHETRRDIGALNADELPIRNYDRLAATAAATAVRKLNDAEDLRGVLAYEAANKNRASVLEAGQARLEDIVNEMAAAS